MQTTVSTAKSVHLEVQIMQQHTKLGMSKREILEAALEGLEWRKLEVQNRIAAINDHMAGFEGYGFLIDFATDLHDQENRQKHVAAGLTPLQAWARRIQGRLPLCLAERVTR